jgi:hypothetical protein
MSGQNRRFARETCHRHFLHTRYLTPEFSYLLRQVFDATGALDVFMAYCISGGPKWTPKRLT